MSFEYSPSASKFPKPIPPRLRSYGAKFPSSSTTNGINSSNILVCSNCEDFNACVTEIFQRLGYIEIHLRQNFQDSIHKHDQLQEEVQKLWNAKKQDRHTIHQPLRRLRDEFDSSAQSLEDCRDGLQTTRHLLQEKVHGLKG